MSTVPETSPESRTGRAHPPIDKPVLVISLVVVAVVLAIGLLVPDQLADRAASVLEWITTNLGWAFVLGATGFVVLALILAFGKTGKIRLGRDDERPEYSRSSWIAMMFSAGMGIGLMFFGVSEPVTHLMTPPEAGVEAGSQASSAMAMDYSLFHWGLHPWAIYAVVGLALAYSSYRRGRTGGFSAAFTPLLRGPRGAGAARLIDILAIFATIFGSAVSLGLGAAQINGGLTRVFGTGSGTGVQVTIIAVLTLCFILSAVSGIGRGVQLLSNINMVLAGVLLFFLFVVGPTVSILDLIPNAAGHYLAALPDMAMRTGAYGGGDWLSGWTIFYWAWWISWTPFVGAFLAKISRGRTIREFVVGVMLIPTAVSVLWFSVFGGSAINLQLRGIVDFTAIDGAESQMYTLLEAYPWAAATSALVAFLVAIFFISGADAASLVMASLSSFGDDEPRRWLTCLWGGLTGAVAMVLLLAGGLEALQSITIIAATPFLVVMVLLCVALIKDLRSDRVIRVVDVRTTKTGRPVVSTTTERPPADHAGAVPAEHDLV